jgi:hypothetical protein
LFEVIGDLDVRRRILEGAPALVGEVAGEGQPREEAGGEAAGDLGRLEEIERDGVELEEGVVDQRPAGRAEVTVDGERLVDLEDETAAVGEAEVEPGEGRQRRPASG